MFLNADQIRFVNAPDKQYLRLGENGHIFCEVTANPSATIQWRRNNVPIKTFDRYIIDHKGLIITDVKASDDGQYLCRASVSATGELTHKYITVEVLIPPKYVFLDLYFDNEILKKNAVSLESKK